jgi:hypothetical protein
VELSETDAIPIPQHAEVVWVDIRIMVLRRGFKVPFRGGGSERLVACGTLDCNLEFARQGVADDDGIVVTPTRIVDMLATTDPCARDWSPSAPSQAYKGKLE